MAEPQIQAERHPIPYRILHLVIITMVLILIVTGFYIHRPFIGGGGFLMSLAQGVHFFATGILIIGIVLRILAMFFGRNRDWPSFIPNGEDIKLIPAVIAHYLHLRDMPELTKKYNPLQMITYIGVFLLAIFQIITGFALLYPEGWLGFINYGIFNNEIETRMAHYIITWLFVLFLMIHVYLGIRENFPEIKVMYLMTKEEEAAKE